MNHHIHQQLSAKFKINLIQNVDPPYLLNERILSKAFRLAGLRSIFPAFSKSRLTTIKKQVENKIDDSGDLNFYHGSTPWILVENKLPYALYLDCCFSSYISVYHDKNKFSESQLEELYTKEADFLSKARYVFFSSRWALNDAAASYKLKADNFLVAGLGGALNVEADIAEKSNPYFLFVGMDFLGKGGDKVVEAYDIVRKEHPQYTLKIAGQQPPQKYLSDQGIKYEGKFDKSNKHDLKKLTNLFSNAFCFVLPTSKDMTPLVLVEASSAGCPVIATNSFGIPEIIKNNETGILLNGELPLKEQLVIAMKELITNQALRQRLIVNSSAFIRDNFTWDRTGKIVCDKLMEKFTGCTTNQ